MNNPYASPTSSEPLEPLDPLEAVEQVEAAPSMTLASIARRTFIAWEKLRILYVGVLVPFTLLCTAFLDVTLLANPLYWISMFICGIFANLCYFAGPVIDTYVTWLGYRGTVLRLAMFVVGTVGCAGLAWCLVISVAASGLELEFPAPD